MKQKITLFLFFGLLSFLLSSYRGGDAAQNGQDCTGATGSSGCSCHGSSTSISTTVELDSAGVPVTSYVPGHAYTIKISATNGTTSTLPKFGFQLTAVQSSSAGTGSAVDAGTWGSVPTGVQLTTPASSGLPINIVEQSTAITATSGTGANGTVYSESIPWTAPAAGTGSVAIYGIVNAVNGNGSSSGDKNNAASPVTITEAASCPTITVSISGSGHTLTANATGVTSYQWYLNGTLISGATSSTYTATTSGSYTVVATTAAGCSGTSSAYSVSTGIDALSLSDAVKLYPTATENNVHVEINGSVGSLRYYVYGLDGKKYDAGNIAEGTSNATISLGHLGAGIYIIRIEDQSHSANYKVVRQ